MMGMFGTVGLTSNKTCALEAPPLGALVGMLLSILMTSTSSTFDRKKSTSGYYKKWIV